ncbi:multiple inositol polyphosphate phosphatase 1-like [Diadema antillarum]|uniref:multiple inositol polyphosphate phosphatase 1-like n=1 Tax=Diadema antillarum TaxID=105358 RepID=UPI003A8B30A8
MIRTLTVILLLAFVVGGQSSSPTPRYSTKTGYETSFEPQSDEFAWRKRYWRAIAQDVGELSAVDQCQPAGVYVVHRHGTRYMSDGDIEDYNSILTRMKTEGVNNNFAYLLDIPDNLYPISMEGELHPAGFAEMRGLGERIRARVPELFSGNDLGNFTFQATCKQRTIDSALGYIEGLLEAGAVCNVTGKTPSKDTVTCRNMTSGDVEVVVIDHVEECREDRALKFYDYCDKFIVTVDKNDTAVIENTKFGRGAEMTAVYQSVAAKLTPAGSSAPFNMTIDELEVLNHMCGYETAYNGSSLWCNLFTDDEKRVIEYYLDLDQNWTEGYGHKINYEIACPLVDDVVSYLERVLNRGTPKGAFKFAHSSTLQPFLTILGLYKDSPKLMADNYNVSINRAWASGRISPMGGHLAFHFFRCPNNDHRVLVQHNELPIQVGACQDFFCPYNTVVTHLTESSNGCSWDKICSLDPDNVGASDLTKYLLVMLILVLSAFLVVSS